jgi:protein-disulfide isomerase
MRNHRSRATDVLASRTDAPARRGYERELALAQALGIDGTPAFVVGGELVLGAVDVGMLRELVNRVRRAA